MSGASSRPGVYKLFFTPFICSLKQILYKKWIVFWPIKDIFEHFYHPKKNLKLIFFFFFFNFENPEFQIPKNPEIRGNHTPDTWICTSSNMARSVSKRFVHTTLQLRCGAVPIY